MPTKTKGKPRNRSAEAKAAGRVLRAFELTPEADQAIDAAAAHLKIAQGTATRVQGLEWLIRQGAKKIPKIIPERT